VQSLRSEAEVRKKMEKGKKYRDGEMKEVT